MTTASPNESTADATTIRSTPAVQTAVSNLLGTRLRCTLEDGRTATGRLVCVDRMRNMILTDCVEERIIDARNYNPDLNTITESDDQPSQHERVVIRHLQQAMVPGERLKKVEVEQAVYQAKVAPALAVGEP